MASKNPSGQSKQLKPQDVYGHLPDISEKDRRDLNARALGTTALVFYLSHSCPPGDLEKWDSDLNFLNTGFDVNKGPPGKGPSKYAMDKFENIRKEAIAAAEEIIKESSENEHHQKQQWQKRIDKAKGTGET